MKPFEMVSPAGQSALLICLFSSLLIGIFYLLLTAGKDGSRWGRQLTAGTLLALFVLLCLLTVCFEQTASGALEVPHFSPPVWTLWAVAGAAGAIFLGRIARCLTQKDCTLGPHSIKQAMDTLPSGIGFFTEAGLPVLCNLQLHRLFWMLAQSDLQHLDELRQALAACGETSPVVKLADEECSYLFPDGKAWRYTQTPVTVSDGTVFLQVVFSDVTTLYEKGLKLREQTKKLEAFARDLKTLSDNVQTLTKESEILAAKTKLHDQMGAGIVAIRQFLRQGPPSRDAEESLRLFQEAVSALKSDNGERGGLAEFLQDAATIGVKVELTGALPQQEEAQRLFVLALRECLSNSVRYAFATELSAAITESGGSVSLCVSNNGTPPQGEIVPRGGLLNLRRHVANSGGRMEIQSLPRFVLTVTVPVCAEGSGVCAAARGGRSLP